LKISMAEVDITFGKNVITNAKFYIPKGYLNPAKS
jgi:hypothetical protein